MSVQLSTTIRTELEDIRHSPTKTGMLETVLPVGFKELRQTRSKPLKNTTQKSKLSQSPSQSAMSNAGASGVLAVFAVFMIGSFPD